MKCKLVDLNNCLPPDRSFVKSICANGGIIRAEASRGCAWGKCRFCAIQHKYCDEARWRDVGISRILKELEQLSNLGVTNPFYTDEDFIGNAPHRAIALADKIIEAKKNDKIEACMTLYVDMRVDSILAKARNNTPSGKEVLQKLKKAGLREVFIGIESGAKEQVKRYRKPSTTERNIQVLQLLKELDLSVDIGFIMFDPEMCLDELFANIHFIKASGLNYHDARLTKCLRIEPKTPMVEDYQKKGLISGKLDMNELIYPYRWANGTVEDVYHVLSHWENQWMNDVYTIQAATRGEVPSEELRKQWRIELGKIRSVEIEVLERLAQSVSKAVNPETVDLEEYTEKQERMVTTLLNQIK